ncbi:XRE family transcriptional regulator [Mesorhizobium sp. CC13]
MIVKNAREPSLHSAIGRAVRAIRTRHGMKISDLAAAADLSIGMLSKIENGGISPSLTTLQAISRGLAVPITWLVSCFGGERPAVFTKAGTPGAATVLRSAPCRQLLGDIRSAGLSVEPHLITMHHETNTFPSVGREGTIFLYVLQGTIAYRHGDQIYRMAAGDSLIFDADILHGPDELIELPFRCLSIMSCRQGA